MIIHRRCHYCLLTRPSHNPVQGVLTRTPQGRAGGCSKIGHGGGVLEVLYLPRAVHRTRVDEVQPQLLPQVHHGGVPDEPADESSPVSVLQAARALGRAHETTGGHLKLRSLSRKRVVVKHTYSEEVVRDEGPLAGGPPDP